MEINTNYKKNPSIKLRTTNPVKYITDNYIELNKIFNISQVILLSYPFKLCLQNKCHL